MEKFSTIFQNTQNIQSIQSIQSTQSTQNIQTKHKIACRNCTRLHHKCDKTFPSCDYCTKRGIKCEVNTTNKKRGRPFGTTKKNLTQKKESEKKIKLENNQAPIIQSRPIIKNEFKNDIHSSFQPIFPLVKNENNEEIYSPINNASVSNSPINYNMELRTSDNDFKPPININWDYISIDSADLFQNEIFRVEENTKCDFDTFLDVLDYQNSSYYPSDFNSENKYNTIF